ncbi:acyl-CoA dehydratase activase [Chloroflexota bacterium]
MGTIQALGIDVGSTTAKIVGIDSAGQMAWHLLEPVEPRIEDQVTRFLEQAGQENGNIEELPLVATGYGRGLVHQATKRVTEITCHAKGIYTEFGHQGLLVDIGGQDSKVIRISDAGKVLDFAMNDKCAAGTGRFLENTASRLGVPLEKIGDEALSTTEEVSISSTCTVFAESEIVSMLSHGVSVPPILRGLHRSLIKRVVAMIRTVGLVPPLMLSGGVVRNPAIRHMLAEETGEEVILPTFPQLMGAYGAALIALDSE